MYLTVKKHIKRRKQYEQVSFCYDRKEFPLDHYAERGLHSVWFFMSVSLVKQASDSRLAFMGQLTLKQKHSFLKIHPKRIVHLLLIKILTICPQLTGIFKQVAIFWHADEKKCCQGMAFSDQFNI